MNNNSVPGLSPAIRLYVSDKLKDRVQGLDQIKDIFDSRDNVTRFHETASREGGAGWVAFYQCLFGVVVNEKKSALKKAGSAPADKRLSEAIGLVRKIAEKTFHLLSKKPFMALFTHLVTLLVHGSRIFPPAALDYTKAIKTLLLYPPHLECLDQASWRRLIRVCWPSLLGDPIRLDDESEDELEDDEEDSEIDVKPFEATQGPNGHHRQRTLSTINSEIAGLLPILFSSSAAPLVSPLPEKDTVYVPEPSTGLTMMLKIHRFFTHYPNDNNAHLPILQSLNLILGEMELNARDKMVSASVKLLPQLASMWSTRKKDIREQVLIALRTLLPFATHKITVEHDKTGSVREALGRIFDYLGKEGQLRWGCQPLDLAAIRLKLVSRKGKEKEDLSPFTTSTTGAGFDFSHEFAVTWVMEDLYADICYYLYDTSHSTQVLTPSTQAGVKRRRIDNALSTLIGNLDAGSTASRLLHIQIMILLNERYYERLHAEAQSEIRRTLMELLDNDDTNVQSWALLALGHLALKERDQIMDYAPTPFDMDEASLGQQETRQKSAQADWDRVWAHATRKIGIAALSRAASHTANCLLACGLAKTARHLRDIRTILANIEVQGPSFPFDSVCAFLCTAVSIARNDATMYQQGLEDKVMGWIGKWSILDGSRGKGRLDQHSAADVYRLLCETTRVRALPLVDIESSELLPDCAVVERLLEETKTRPLRRLILYALYPTKNASKRGQPEAAASGRDSILTSNEAGNGGLGVLEGRPRVATAFLTSSIDAFIRDWTSTENHASFAPDRVRKAIDLIVLTLAYLGTLKSAGLHMDTACMQAAIRLLELVGPALSAHDHSLPGQYLMWAGLRPLASVIKPRSALWPIMLDASIDCSGIRRSLFPAEDPVDANDAPEPESELQQRIWKDPSMGAALKELFSIALGSLEAISHVSTTFGSTPYQQTITTADDFGEIKIAESDTMPQSREAIECKTTSSNLLLLLARYRVCGTLRASPSGHPGRDTPLINAWLSTEGPKFIQIGEVICGLLKDGLLRLSLDAVDLVLGALEEMAGSYAFARDEGLLQVALEFLAHSATVWLSPEADSSNLPERAIAVAKFLLTKTKRGQVASWKVRLALILFLDEYLDYDPSASLWIRISDENEMEVDGNEPTPFTYFLDALVDTDARVRIRAASSAAGIFYLSGLPPANHQDLYFQALERQPGQTNHWDSFMNHLLWKLNCCVASMSLRATTMFHLYEIPPTTNSVHQHFQAGLEAVAERLNLDSIATLFRPYATIICLSQVGSGQKTMMQPFRLYGFPTKAAFGASLLSLVGSSVLIEENGLTVIKDACEASSTPIDWAVQQVLPTAIALSLGSIIPSTFEAKAVDSEMSKIFTKTPGIRNGKQVQEAITSKIDLVLANLLVLLDLDATTAQMCELLKSSNIPSSDPSVLHQLLSTDDSTTNGGTAALSPSLSAQAVMATRAYCISRYTDASPTRIVFVALEVLFKQMNATFLASEERRYLRALALVISLYVDTMRVDVILQVFLREIITRIDKTDYPDIVVQMLQWGFDQVSTLPSGLEQMPEIMIQLGEVRHRLDKTGGGEMEMGQMTAAAIDSWLISQIPIWIASETLRDSLDFAMAFWPNEVTAMFENWREPNFVDLAFIADTRRSKSFSSMTLCSGLARGMPIGNREEHIDAFVKHVFWHLKATLAEDTCTTEGVAGLLDLLAQVDGEIHAPDLSTANELSIDEVRAKYDQKLAGEPALMLRAILIGKVADLTQDKVYTLRSTALEVLRRSYATIHELLQRGVFPGKSHPQPLLELLLPVDVPKNVSLSNLDVLGQTDSWIRRSRSSESWASRLSLLFCEVLAADDPFYRSFIPLLDLSAKTASDFLPWFVQALLTVGSAKRVEVAEQRSSILSAYFTKVIQWSAASKNAIATIIKTVLHLRGFVPGFRTGVMAFNSWLEIDPVLLSEAAIKCGAFATAMLFLEILKDIRDDKVDLLDPRIQNIMYQIYSNVEDPDGFYGIQTRDIRGALSRRLQHEKLSLRAFGLYGAAFETTASKQSVKESIIPLMTNLHDIGFDRLSSGIYKSTRSDPTQEDEYDPLLLDLAWRTGDWDLPVSDELATTSQGSFYSCLQAVHRQRDQSAAKVLVDKAVRSEVGRLGELGLEQIAQIKQSSTNLVCLREIALWLDPETQSAISTGDSQCPPLQRLKTLNDSMDYPVAERLTATRLSLLRAAQGRESKFLFGDMTTPQTTTILEVQKALYLQLGRLARKDGKLQASINAITAVQNLEIGTAGSNEANDEFGHVLWAQKEHSLAIQHLEQMMGDLKQTSETGGRMAVLLAQTAHWTSVAKMRAPQDIRGFFDKAYNLIRPSKLARVEQARICHEYALFADGHYQSLSKSPELERLRATRDRTLAVLENIESASKTSKSKSASARTDQSRHQDILEDDKALKDLENELTSYAKTAMKMFAMSLTASDEFDDSITRLCSLWLERDSSDEVNRSFSGPLQAIPSHKFIFLGPQLAARLYKPKQPVQFNTSLNSLMLRIARDHPFHILYQIITVAHGADKPNANSSSSKSRRESEVPMEEGRMPAALEILDRLQGDNDRALARDAANQMSRFTAAAVPWCHYQEKEKKTARNDQPQIPHGTALLGFTNVKIPPPSVIPPVDLTKKYSSVATIQRYRTHYRILGGIHRPKRMTCIDSSGREHYELFKGDDELRQDAVMEQVFEMTNRILSRDRKTKARSLRFRTYAVIPLPNRSGVMEFVGDSQAIGEYLKPAHIKYREGLDHPPDHMRKKLEEIQIKDHNSSELPKRYTELITKFKPVMRHYFTEKHREPMAWFSMRLNYIRSVAVTSIVGHILGIGDRHCSNILIDKLTGELVHIDFGIVFEDGRRLRIPERVPFRLTNDIVDGLGLTGVDGTFRQCSEHTLRVLRESSDLILTVLEVFKHDPLYAWAADTEKLKRAQGGGRVDGQSASATEKADRVLSKIRKKLRPDLSVEYTVNQLIQEARNVDNLAKIFIGWQPWL